MVYRDGAAITAWYQRGELETGNEIQGPALVLQMETTVVVPPGWYGAVDPYGNLLLEPE